MDDGNGDLLMDREEVRKEVERLLGEAGVSEEHKQVVLSMLDDACGETVNLERAGLGDAGARAVALALMFATSVRVLNLISNSIGDEGGKAIGEALTNNTSVTHLDLTWNNIGAEGGKAIAGALASNTSVTHLYLSYNNIYDEGGKAIAEALISNTSVTHLHLSRNNIGNEGVLALASMLKNNSTLTHLELNGCELDDASATAIAEALRENANSALKHLCIDSSSIGEDGAIALADMIKCNTVLDKTTFASKLTGLAKLAVQLRFQAPVNVQDSLGPGTAVVIAHVLSDNPPLTRLSIKDNDIDDVGVMLLASALGNNSKLRELRILNCSCDVEEAEALLGVMASPTSALTTLSLFGEGLAASHRFARILAEFHHKNANLNVSFTRYSKCK